MAILHHGAIVQGVAVFLQLSHPLSRKRTPNSPKNVPFSNPSYPKKSKLSKIHRATTFSLLRHSRTTGSAHTKSIYANGKKKVKTAIEG